MAKSLQERIASARSTDRATIETLTSLVADVETERTRLTAAHERASAESIDYLLAESDRDEAAANAARYARNIAALTSALAELGEKLEAKRNSDAQKSMKAEEAAAIAERDKLAAQFAERVPLITAELIELFQAVSANADRMRAAGMNEVDAEFTARKVPGNGYIGPSPVPKFTSMKIPEFAGAGRVWPVDWSSKLSAAVCADISEIRRQQFANVERQQEEKRLAAEEHARSHGQYSVAPKSPDEFPTFEWKGRRWPHFAEPTFHGELSLEKAEELRKDGRFLVTLLEPVPAA
ncbi:MAG: hypothetical protein KJ755_16325 [Alphaproteobacteria bacterium]|nr:hypothetical protein [Alphaproteobacteria bacterium]